jgi:regulator of protease activity HflC (stomatin/prohibitin superfamily)
MGTIIWLSILLVLTLASAFMAITARPMTITVDTGRYADRHTKEINPRRWWLIPTVVFGLTFAVSWLLNSYVNVPARTVDIQQSFGKAVGTLTPGLNWITPWSEVTEFPTLNQPLDLDATDNTDSSKASPVGVKFLGGGAGAVNVNMNWQIKTDNDAIKLWENWKSFDLVRDKVVNQKAQSTVAEVFGKYTPEDAVKGENIPKLATAIKESLNTKLVVDGIMIEDVNLKKIDLDGPIQDRINKQVEDQADNNRAVIKQQTAKTDAETNRIAQQNLTDPVLKNKCLDITNNWSVAKNGPMPANWQCGVAGGLPLTVPAN